VVNSRRGLIKNGVSFGLFLDPGFGNVLYFCQGKISKLHKQGVHVEYTVDRARILFTIC